MSMLSGVYSFIADSGEELGWGDLEGVIVMDIGCGTGLSSLAIVSTFPKLKFVIAIDNDKNKLAVAEEQAAHPKIFYQEADIGNKFTLDAWTGYIEKAVSVYCLLLSAEKRVFYENLYMMLKPGGEAAIKQSINSPSINFLVELRSTQNWKEFLKESSALQNLDQKIPIDKTPISEYRKIMQDIGFEVIACSQQDEAFTFTNRNECQEAVFKDVSLAFSIPEEKRKELKEEAFRLFLKDKPIDRNGHYKLSCSCMIAYLRKPHAKSDHG